MNSGVTVLGMYTMCLLVFCPWAWIFVFVPTLLTYLGRTANPGRDDVFAVIIHAWAWDGTRFLKLVWLPLIPSPLNIWLIAAWKSSVLGLRFSVLPRDKFGKGIPFESFCELPSNVPCPAHCITWRGRRVCSSRTCLCGWMQTMLFLTSSSAPQLLLSVWPTAGCEEAASFHLLQMWSVGTKWSHFMEQRAGLYLCGADRVLSWGSAAQGSWAWAPKICYWNYVELVLQFYQTW